MPFGGTQTEMEVIAYRDALKKFEKAHGDSHKGAGKGNKKDGDTAGQ